MVTNAFFRFLIEKLKVLANCSVWDKLCAYLTHRYSPCGQALAADIRQILGDAGITVMQEMGLLFLRQRGRNTPFQLALLGVIR